MFDFYIDQQGSFCFLFIYIRQYLTRFTCAQLFYLSWWILYVKTIFFNYFVRSNELNKYISAYLCLWSRCGSNPKYVFEKNLNFLYMNKFTFSFTYVVIIIFFMNLIGIYSRNVRFSCTQFIFFTSLRDITLFLVIHNINIACVTLITVISQLSSIVHRAFL